MPVLESRHLGSEGPMSARADRSRAWQPLLAALLAIGAFWAAGSLRTAGLELGLGSLKMPTPLHRRFLILYVACGLPAALLLAYGLDRLRSDRDRPILAALSDRRFLVYAAIIGALIPAAIRQWVLQGADMTDDESAYRLMGHLLASGQLYMHSPPFKEFFDNRMLVNDGKLYSTYFVGWPALMAPGVLVGVERWMNILYSALTVPPLFWLCRRLSSPSSARLVVLCYLTSPILMVGAATGLSHTSCLALLTWLAFVTEAARRPDASPWSFAGASALFSAAFFVRPQAVIAIGLPFLVALAMHWKRRRRGRLCTLAAFAAPSLAFAIGFLAVNQVQTGDALKPAYVRTAEYVKSIDYKHSTWEHDPSQATRLPGFVLPGRDMPGLATTAGLLRLNFALFGWSSSFLLAFFARGRRSWVYWGSAALFVLWSLVFVDAGVDTFGPVHFFELALPLLVLTGLGLESPSRWRSLLPSGHALVVGFVLVALTTYTPVRIATAHRIAQAILFPQRMVESISSKPALVFVHPPFTAYKCLTWPSLGWVFARPSPSPERNEPIVWLNDIGPEENLRVAAMFPQREAFLSFWGRDCRMHLVRLAPRSADTEGAEP